MSLPDAVNSYLRQLMTGVFEPAFILVDGENVVREVGGGLARYGLESLAVGQRADDQLWFLAGVLPIDGGDTLVLPSVSVGALCPAHIHLIPVERGTWVLLVDASGEVAQQQVFQQTLNQRDLIRQRREPPVSTDEATSSGEQLSPAEMVLATMDCVLLERCRGSHFIVHGSTPGWLNATIPVVDGRIDVSGNPFLADFLEQAEVFWQDHTTGRLESGLWTENKRGGGEEHLEAVALASGDRSTILLHRRTEEHDERQRMLQSARDRHLQFERLVKDTRNNEVLVHCIIHDLNGPLTGMLGCLDLLALQDLPSGAGELIKLAQRQAYAQQGLVRGILDAFSAEVESLRQVESDPRFAPNLLNEARSAVESFNPVAKTHGVSLGLSAPPGEESTWKVVGDADRLQRILANLIDNALRHSPPRSAVHIRLTREGQRIYCDVEDEGPGVPDEIAGTLFDKLTKTADGGGQAGLGLYFCRITVERWGGEIGLRPRIGGGTSFWFQLEAADSRALSPAEVSALLKGVRVLVVEDDDVSRLLIREMLATAEVEIVEAADGEAGLTAAGIQPFDVVLVDVHLPGISGYDLAARLRSRSGAKSPPIVAMTGDARVPNADQRSTIDEIIRKPFSADRLRVVLARSLGAATGAPPTERKQDFDSGMTQPIQLPGIDIERTVTRLGGDVGLLNSMLARFEGRCREVIEEFRELLSQGRTDETFRLAHSLKGTAANLGAVGVERAAAHLENGLRSPDVDTTAMTDELTRAISELSASLRQLGVGAKDA